MGIGSRLKTIRRDLKLNQDEFSKYFSVSLKSVSNYENDITPIAQDLLIKLLERGYSIPWLLTGEGTMRMSDYRPKQAIPFETKGEIPLIGETAAGYDGFYNDNDTPRISEATEFIPRPMNIKDPLAYAVRISSLNGDSMSPAFKPEEILIVSPMATVFNNDKAIIKLNDGQIMFKIYHCAGDHVELISLNPAYPLKSVKPTDMVFAHKVVGSWGK